MDNLSERHIPRADFIGLASAVIGAMISMAGASGVYVSQASTSVTTLWPLPGFVLLEWALLGIFEFIAAYYVFRWSSIKWQQAAWSLTGALIPLIILGAFSIGPLVLITFLLFVISIGLFAIRTKPRWLPSIGALALGVIINLGLLLLIITLMHGTI